jgi:catechol 2,3-dioxygenase-like lactoylglutathione lyase family enzyme
LSNFSERTAIYGGALGLPLIGHEPGRHAFFQVGDAGMLLVFDPAATQLGKDLPPYGATGPGHFALGIRADDLDVWRRHLIGSGVAIEKEVVWPRGGHSLYFRDPAGNSAEVVTPGVWGTPAGW